VIEFVVAGELATLCMELQQTVAQAPSSLAAEPSPLDPRRHIDPPGVIDGRWLEAPDVSWAVPVVTADSTPRPTAYAVARGFGAAAMEMRVERRASGGWTPFVAAEDPEKEPPALVRFNDGVPERFPGDTNTVVFSVAATDWFGRWTGRYPPIIRASWFRPRFPWQASGAGDPRIADAGVRRDRRHRVHLGLVTSFAAPHHAANARARRGDSGSGGERFRAGIGGGRSRTR
jgi:hypothetical protein